MACSIAQGNELGCRDSVGGIETIYITEFENVTSITSSSGQISAITKSGGTSFKVFKLEKENAEFTEAINSSVENGTLFYEQTLSFTMKKMSASNRNNIRNIAQNRLMVIVKDNNGTYWVMGETRGADLTGDNSAKTGKAFGDMNGYSLTLVGKEPAPAQVYTGSITSLQS